MSSQSASTTTVVLLASVILLVLELGGLGGYHLYHSIQFRQLWERELERSRALEAEQRDKDRQEAKGRRVELASVTSDCYADNSLATCYVTNFTEQVVTVCMQGVVMQKESAGVRLYSMPMCSGPIRPLQTASVAAPWDGGRPQRICHDARGYMDWDTCDFTVLDHKPEAQKK